MPDRFLVSGTAYLVLGTWLLVPGVRVDLDDTVHLMVSFFGNGPGRPGLYDLLIRV